MRKKYRRCSTQPLCIEKQLARVGLKDDPVQPILRQTSGMGDERRSRQSPGGQDCGVGGVKADLFIDAGIIGDPGDIGRAIIAKEHECIGPRSASSLSLPAPPSPLTTDVMTARLPVVVCVPSAKKAPHHNFRVGKKAIDATDQKIAVGQLGDPGFAQGLQGLGVQADNEIVQPNGRANGYVRTFVSNNMTKG